MTQSVKIVVWQQDDTWFGYLQDYPDYWTQGKTQKLLEVNLRDLYKDVTSGEIPGIIARLRFRAIGTTTARNRKRR